MYVGLATGVVSLANATVGDDVAVNGSTFDAAAKVGYAIPFQPNTPLEKQRVYGFIEADYHVRYFDLVYGAGAPAGLPSRMYLGGATASIGIQVMINADKAKGAKAAKSGSANRE